MAVINPKSMANILVSPEVRRENQQKASITRRLNAEKEYEKIMEKIKELGLEGKSSKFQADMLGLYPGKILAARRYMKNKQEQA